MSASFSEQELNAFFSNVPKLGRLASRFRPIEYFRPGEVTLSRIMADLLDPRGSHGHGDDFLGAFLRRVMPEHRFGSKLGEVIVVIEEQTKLIEDNKRRMDITLTSEKFVLGIENKPWASEGPGQVKAYLEDLRKRGKSDGHLLLYLSGDGSKPATLTPDEIEELKILRYWDALESWLKDCKNACTTDPTDEVYSFLKIFHQYALTQKEAQVLTEYILKDKSGERLRIALAVAASAEEVRGRIMMEFLKDVEGRVATLLGEKAVVRVSTQYETYSGVYAGMKTWPYEVTIESQGRGCKFILGVMNKVEKNEVSPKFPNLVNELSLKLGKGTSTKWCEWWIPLGPPFGGSQVDEIVLEIQRGREKAVEAFAKRIAEAFRLVEDLPQS